MVSQQAASLFLKTTTEGELIAKGGYLFHGMTMCTKKQLCDKPDEQNDDATSGRDYEGENKKVV